MLTKKSDIMKMINTSVFVSFLGQGLVKSMGEEPVVLPNLSKCIPLKRALSRFLPFFQKAKTRLRINSVPGTGPTFRVLK